MPAIKVTRDYFSGTSKLFGTGGLGEVIRGLAVDHARIKLEIAAIGDLTDNTTGVAALSVVDQVLPTAVFDASAAGGATRTEFNTAIGKFEDAGKVLVNAFNDARARLGLPLLSAASGAEAAADTIPAQDKSVNTTSGATSLNYTAGRTAMQKAKDNLHRLVRGLNDIRVAVGHEKLATALSGSLPSDYALVTIADAAADADGATAISKAVADTFLDSLADNLATIAASWNDAMFQTGLSDLTDSSGGTPAAGLAVNTIPALAAGAATTSSPKAGFDTRLGVIEGNLSDLCARMNLLRARYGLAKYTDSTGVTPDTTLAAQNAALAAVDGSTGTDAVDGATARTRMQTIHNALSSLAVGINELCGFFGIDELTDALVGSTLSTTIANIAATGTGVGQDVTPDATLLDSAVDTWLTTCAHNVATLATKLNAMTGVGSPNQPLGVVAA